MATAFPARTASLIDDGAADGSCLVADASAFPVGALVSLSSKTLPTPRSAKIGSKLGSGLQLVNSVSGDPLDIQQYRIADDAMITMAAQSLASGAPTPVTVPTGSTADICGKAVLVAGTVTVTTTAVNAASIVHLTRQVTGGAVGHLTVGTITAGTSFVINSSSGTDTSTVGWSIIN